MKYAAEVRPRTQPRRARPEAGGDVCCVFVIISSRDSAALQGGSAHTTPEGLSRVRERLSDVRQRQAMLRPPSATRFAPVMKLASADPRKATALAISSGVPNRPVGMRAAKETLKSSSLSAGMPSLVIIGVSIGPGLT